MKFYLINSVSGSSGCLFNVYYNSVNTSNTATIYGATTPYLPATNIPYSQISSGNLVVVLPDTAGSIIIQDNCGCPPLTTVFPSPTPTTTPTMTPTKTRPVTPTPTRTLTPSVTTTKTSTPTRTPSRTPTLQITRTPTQTPTLTRTPTRTPTSQPLPPVGRPFISVWRTTAPNEMIELPYDPSGIYDGSISWGDGTSSINSYANRRHTYSIPGTYTVTILGRIIGWSFFYSS